MVYVDAFKDDAGDNGQKICRFIAHETEPSILTSKIHRNMTVHPVLRVAHDALSVFTPPSVSYA